jgi:hypothetical protein
MIKRIDLIAGARPNFMKIAPIITARKVATDGIFDDVKGRTLPHPILRYFAR